MTKPVVVGVDGSRQSLAAADWAARTALRRELPLRLIHAWESVPGRDIAETRPPGRAVPQYWARRVLRGAMERISERYPRLYISAEQVHRPPTAGPAGRGRGCRAAGHRERGPRPAGPVTNRCRSPSTRPPGAALRAVHIRHLPITSVPGEHGSERTTIEEMLRPWQEKYPTVPVTAATVHARTPHEIVHASEGAGLMVLGRRPNHRPGLGPHAGAVTHAVIHHVACPVAFVPHP